MTHSSSKSNHSLTLWLQENRVMNDTLLSKLDELGANQVVDLLDLTPEDVESFQPFLKKLEFVRFKRALALLQSQQNAGGQEYNVSDSEIAEKSLQQKGDILPPAVITIDTTTATSGSSATSLRKTDLPPLAKKKNRSKRSVPNWNDDDIMTASVAKQHLRFPEPPLPPSCPEKNCHGTLSSQLGKRRIKALMKFQGPDCRWIVTCSECSNRWHACHFLCGYMSKISRPTGSSDIIRHELGRYNRWQNKITPPCKNNPLSKYLKGEYSNEQVQHRMERSQTNNDVPIVESPCVVDLSVMKSDAPSQHDDSEEQVSLSASFLNDLDCPLANGHGSCEFTQEQDISSYTKRTRVNDKGEYTGSTLEDDEIDETCDEIKKLLLGECNRHGECSVSSDHFLSHNLLLDGGTKE